MRMLNAKRDKWVNILLHFGCHPDNCEDLIQDMYIKFFEKLKSGGDILYKKKAINYYYVFKVLRSIYVDSKRKEKVVMYLNIKDLDRLDSDPDNTDLYDSIEGHLKKMYWYDRKVFEIITEGESIRQLSHKTGISYHSLYNSFKRTKNKIKKLL